MKTIFIFALIIFATPFLKAESKLRLLIEIEGRESHVKIEIINKVTYFSKNQSLVSKQSLKDGEVKNLSEFFLQYDSFSEQKDCQLGTIDVFYSSNKKSRTYKMCIEADSRASSPIIQMINRIHSNVARVPQSIKIKKSRKKRIRTKKGQ